MTLAPDLTAAFYRGLGVRHHHGADRWPGPLDVLTTLDPRTVRTPALELIDQEMRWLDATPDGRLMVMMAPQEGKSSLVTHAGTTWFMHRHPTWRVVVASYADRVARRFSRRIRNGIVGHQGQDGRPDFGLRLAPDQRAANEWELTTGGSLWATGVGGALTSVSAELLVIDDPLKGRKDADSDIKRDDAWDWWESTASSRFSPGARVILILTRWHHDDLAGRLIKHQPEKWRMVHIPAQADHQLVYPDPLGRADGEYMVSARGRTQAQWESRKQDAGSEWTPLYQGDPQAAGGRRFDIDRLRYWHRSRDGGVDLDGHVYTLAEMYRYITIDTATTKTSTSDWTVASCWGIPPSGHLVLLDVRRARTAEHEQLGVAQPLVDLYRPDRVWIEPSLKGSLLIRQAVAAGWDIGDLVPDTNKLLRAGPAAGRVKEGRVWFPAVHPLRDTIVKELKEFPTGRHDDFVDTLSYAETVRFDRYVSPGAEVTANAVTRPPLPDPYQTVLGESPDWRRTSW